MVILMRGIQGSGKSTWVKKNYPKAVVCSADDYHIVEGEYKFDPRKLGEAHDKCFLKYLQNLLSRTDADIVVDNTNANIIELAPYVRLAEVYPIDYKIITMFCEPHIAWARNIHNVPLHIVVNCYHEISRPLPKFWHQEMVV